jgi:hypothetical protein
MGCDLVYNNRELIQLRTGKVGVCNIWYTPSSGEDSRKLIGIRKSLGPNKWASSYVNPQRLSKHLINENYYWIEGADVRYLFVDSNGDAWLFPVRVDFEAAINNYNRQGPAFHLQNATHYSQVVFQKKVSIIPSRYARILSNKVFESVEAKPESEPIGSGLGQSCDPLKDILDFEFNRPKPPKLDNPYKLDFDEIGREAIGVDLKPR